MTNSCLEFLGECEWINLKNCHNITDKGIGYLRNCHTLNLEGCQKITDVGLTKLGNCNVLYLSNCSGITDNGIKELCKCKELSFDSLDISNNCLKNLNCNKLSLFNCSKITDEGVKYGKNYKVLKLMYCDNITNEGIKNINCESLYLSNINVTDEGIKNINCESLYLSDINVTDKGLKNLKGCKKVSLFACDLITDAGISELDCNYLEIFCCRKLSFSKAHKYKFRQLKVSNWIRINDEILQNFRGLEMVNVSKCNITDEGIFHLKNCKKVILVECFKITRKAILNLKCDTIIICECMNLNIQSSNVICVSKHECILYYDNVE